MHNLSYSKFEEKDFDDYFLLVSNADVMKQIIGRPHTLEEAKEIFKGNLENNMLHPQCGTYKIVNADNGAFVGFVKLELEAATRNEAEIGYMLLPQYWGKGYGKQVAEYVLNIAKDIEQLTRLTGNIDPENKGSRKILTNHGFTSEKLFDWHGLPAELLVRDI